MAGIPKTITMNVQMVGAVDILQTLDALACALADHDHVWTDEERAAYEKAVRSLSCKANVDVGNLGKRDISLEQWREYEWEGRSTPYRINSPVTLYLRKGGSTHRVVDADGVAHCVPTVGERGCILRWKNLDGVAPVNF